VEEQRRSGFRYVYAVYQVEYSRNLLFRSGGQMEQVFQGLIDRTRARLTVRDLKTIFGAKRRPFRHKAAPPPRMAVVLETPVYDLTVFKLHFGQLTLKAYTKGEHVLRFEAIVHNTKALGCGRVVAKFPQIVARLHNMVEGFFTTLHAMDQAFVPDDTLEHLPIPSVMGNTRVGGIDLNKPRLRTVRAAVLALAPAPQGFRVADVAAQVQAMPARAPGSTGRATPPTISRSSGPSTSWSWFPPRAGIAFPPRESAPSPLWSSCATKPLRRSWRARPSPRWAGSQRTGALSTSTMKRSARTCRPCSRIWALPPSRLGTQSCPNRASFTA